MHLACYSIPRGTFPLDAGCIFAVRRTTGCGLVVYTTMAPARVISMITSPRLLPMQPRAQDALHRDNIPPPLAATADCGAPILHCPVYYPKHEASASGAYSLLAYGVVAAHHPEHPDAFLPELIAMQAAREAHARDSGQPVRFRS